jgi:alkanesulfonate monooxygenase SsuD/methylene tetrahydromethanopterin reductase-like flavin-dependent oxidoreductase (luciferase family)
MERSTPRAVEVGCLSVRLPTTTAHERRRIIQLAEDVGLDHVAVGDHVSFYVGMGFDGLMAATCVLACSERLRSNTAAYLLPLRHPVLVARQLADISVLAPSRFRFGVGIGGEDPHELEICGIDPKTRGRRMDECIRLVGELLTGNPVDHSGEFFKVTQARIEPAPKDPVPFIVGGRSDAAIERAGRFGDGWLGIWVSPTRYKSSVDLMLQTADEAGRSEHPFTNALNVWCGVDSSPGLARHYVSSGMELFYQMPYERFEKWSPAGKPEQIVEFLLPYVAAGCSVFNLIVQGENGETEIEAAAEIREGLIDATT